MNDNTEEIKSKKNSSSTDLKNEYEAESPGGNSHYGEFYWYIFF